MSLQAKIICPQKVTRPKKKNFPIFFGTDGKRPNACGTILTVAIF
jgi:hypothetical protein